MSRNSPLFFFFLAASSSALIHLSRRFFSPRLRMRFILISHFLFLVPCLSAARIPDPRATDLRKTNPRATSGDSCTYGAVFYIPPQPWCWVWYYHDWQIVSLSSLGRGNNFARGAGPFLNGISMVYIYNHSPPTLFSPSSFSPSASTNLVCLSDSPIHQRSLTTLLHIHSLRERIRRVLHKRISRLRRQFRKVRALNPRLTMFLGDSLITLLIVFFFFS